MVQLSREVTSITSEYRKHLLDEIFKQPGRFLIEIPPTQSLALKSDLQLPWAKLREMRRYRVEQYAHYLYVGFTHYRIRWMKSWGVALSSEQRMRSVSSQLIGQNLEAETIPLAFKRDSGNEIIPAPIAYIPDLWMKVEGFLNNCDESGQRYKIFTVN